MVACSSDDSNANPTPVVNPDSGAANQIDSYVPPTGDDDGSITPTVVTREHLGIDANLPDVGACVSDAATCNSCYTVQQNPLNGCSPATVNCIPFDNTRVPVGAP